MAFFRWHQTALGARAGPAARAAAAPGVCAADHAGASRQRHRLNHAGSALDERRAACVTRCKVHSGGPFPGNSDAAMPSPSQRVRSMQTSIWWAHRTACTLGCPVPPVRSRCGRLHVTHRPITVHDFSGPAGSVAARSDDAAQAEREAHCGGGSRRDGQCRCDQRRCGCAAGERACSST